MRIAKVEDGIVTQVLIYPDDQSIPDGWLDGTNANVDWEYDGNNFIPKHKTVPVQIPDLTFAQLLIGLVTVGWIREEEGEAWLMGTVPDAVNAVLSQLPPEQRFAAKARAIRPSVVKRDDPLVEALGELQKKSKEELDEFFITFAKV